MEKTNKTVMEFIYQKAIEKIKQLDNSKLVIAIAGAGCIGKSTFGKQLQECFKDAEYVELDGYMLPREEAYKIEQGLTGYNPRRNEIYKAQEDLSNLINNNIPYTLYIYNRSNHQRDIEVHLKPKDVIIIDGVHVLDKRLLSLSNFKIFFDSSKKVQYELRLKRESIEFGSDEQQVKKRMETYHPDYLAYIAPAKEHADYVLKTGLDYKLSIERKQ